MKSTQLKPFIYKDLRLKMSKCQFFAQNIQKYFFLYITILYIYIFFYFRIRV